MKLNDVVQECLACGGRLGEDLGDLSPVGVDGGSGELGSGRRAFCWWWWWCCGGDRDPVLSDAAAAGSATESSCRENFLGGGSAGGTSDIVEASSSQVRARSMPPRRREWARSWLATAVADLGGLAAACGALT